MEPDSLAKALEDTVGFGLVDAVSEAEETEKVATGLAVVVPDAVDVDSTLTDALDEELGL